MNMILIVREEIVCLAMLFFLFYNSRLYRLGNDNKYYSRMLVLASGHVIFDVITLWTVNHTESVPYLLNYIVHILFYLFAIYYVYEVMNYVFSKLKAGSKPQGLLRRYQIVMFWLPVLYILLLPVLPMQFLQGNGTKYSYGPAAIVGYAIAFWFILSSAVIIIVRRKELDRHTRRAMFPMLFLILAAETVQIFVPEFLFTGGCVTVVTLGVFFSLENPAFAFRQKALMDALTGVKSRNAYEMEMKELKQQYQEGKFSEKRIGFAFCDINGLKVVNDKYGHLCGDEYIGTVAKIISDKMVSVDSIYRLGGDEFLAVYIGAEEAVMQKEIQAVRKGCEVINENSPYPVEVAIGYAMSSPEYEELDEVLRAADHSMYENKWMMKNIGHTEMSSEHIEKTGLDDRVFEAFASTSERTYFYLCNLKTNVSRWSRVAVEYFGLPGEYMLDAATIWEEHIHPSDRDVYRTDIDMVFSGKKQYHDLQYRARNRDGRYVVCTCRGTILKGQNGEPDLFAGTMMNHGIMDEVDSVTELPSNQEYVRFLDRMVAAKAQLTILKIGIMSFGRINILYGASTGNDLLRQFASQLKQLVGGLGNVFRLEGAKFAVCLQSTEAKQVEALYERAEETAAQLQIEDLRISLKLSGGAVIVDKPGVEQKWIRSGLEYCLSQSKREYHGKLIFWNSQTMEPDNRRLYLYQLISKSIVRGCEGFYLEYQPVICAKTEKLCGMEALLRWRHPELGEVMPGRFISWLENDSCFGQLGEWIIRTAIQAAKPLRAANPDFLLNINVTATQLMQNNFPDRVIEILRQYDYPPEALCLELTERCRSMDYLVLKECIRYIHEKGIRIAIDDLGTGSSALMLMMELPVDMVKIDMNMIRGIHEKHNNQMFVRTILDLANRLGLSSCLEGIEDPLDYEYIRTLQASVYQGYYFSKPVGIEEVCRMQQT